MKILELELTKRYWRDSLPARQGEMLCDVASLTVISKPISFQLLSMFKGVNSVTQNWQLCSQSDSSGAEIVKLWHEEQGNIFYSPNR